MFDHSDELRNVVGYVDVDYASDFDSRKFMTCFVFTWRSNLVKSVL